MNPTHPLYIVSKGRWKSRITANYLDQMGVPFRMIVEEQEHADYAAVIGAKRLLVLDRAYQRDYDTFDALGETKSKGPGPARNFAWDHAKATGASWHWVLDDNIRGFFRFNKNLKVPVSDGTCFRAMEDFVERYSNVAMAGPNYFMFAARKTIRPPFQLNTRIYSCNLIRNDLPFRWRGRYNEDTDLSLNMLKAGFVTVLFNAFLQYKMPTQTVKGGNHADFYAKEGTLPKSQMQVRMHPDVSRLVHKFGRWHHHVDYARFKTPLRRRPGVELPGAVNDYGMQLFFRDQAPAS